VETERTRLVLEVKSGKMELEGSEEFVVRQFDRLASFLTASEDEGGALVLAPPVDPPPVQGVPAPARDIPAATMPPELPQSFGVWLERLRGERPRARDVERVLWAGYHIQLRSKDGAFTASQVTALLRQHGIQVKYPSQAVHQNRRTGKVTRIGRGRFRLTPDGIAKITRHLAA